MFILRDLLVPLQAEFSKTDQGQKRKVWFAYTLLAVCGSIYVILKHCFVKNYKVSVFTLNEF